MSRMNIELDNDLVSKALELTGVQTVEELVNLALLELIRKENQKSVLSLPRKHITDIIDLPPITKSMVGVLKKQAKKSS